METDEDCSVSTFSLGTKSTSHASVDHGMDNISDRRTSAGVALKPQPRKTAIDMSDISINKLNFKSLGLFGREEELARLSCCLKKVETPGNSRRRQVVFVSGYSGVGKSELLSEAFEKPMKIEMISRKSVSSSSSIGAADDMNGIYASGKFEQYSDEPYLGLAMAVQDICEHFLGLKFENPILLQKLRSAILAELGPELTILTQMIPMLTIVLEEEEEENAQDGVDAAEVNDYDTVSSHSLFSTRPNQSAEQSKVRFQIAVQQFFRVIGKFFQPFVLVLDDLQWADASSVELLEVLIKDRKNPNLLVAGVYRSNEVGDTHILTQTLNQVRSIAKGSGNDGPYDLDLTEIDLANLDVPAVQGILRELLSSGGGQDIGLEETEETQRIHELAQLCMNKTRGNAFFLIRFLSMLTDMNLLTYSFGAMKWKWNTRKIFEETVATENVVDMLTTEMKRLPGKKIRALQIMACLGSSFRRNLFKLVWEEIDQVPLPVAESKQKEAVVCGVRDECNSGNNDETTNGMSMESELGFFVAEGYIRVRKLNTKQNSDSPSSADMNYRWVHDKIQEAAISLVPDVKRQSFQTSVGQVLLSKLDEDELDSSIFVVANLIHISINEPEGRISTPLREEREKALHEMAELNCKACEKATALVAFERAAAYADKALACLGPDPWKVDSLLALKLFSLAAEAQGQIGNDEKRVEYCNEVILRSDCPKSKKFKVYHVWLDHLLACGTLEEGKKFGLDILAQFGCRFPKNSVLKTLGALSNISSIKFNKKKYLHTDDLGAMDDLEALEVMRFLDRFTVIAYGVGDGLLTLLVIFRMLTLQLKHGWCAYSLPAYSSAAVVLGTALQDYETGYDFGQHALKLMTVTRSRLVEARVMQSLYGLVFQTKLASRECAKGALRAYEVGMKTGDTEIATWAAYNRIQLLYQAGEFLDVLIVDSRVYSNQMIDLRRDRAANSARVTLQFLVNLAGQNHEFLVMQGKVLEDKDYKTFDEDRSFYDNFVPVHQGLLFTYYGDHVSQAELALKWGDRLEKVNPGVTLIYIENYMKAVSCIVAARQTGRRKYRNEGRRRRRKVHTWIKKGHPNVVHYGDLIDAEWAALKHQKTVAIKCYQEAVIKSARGGYLHDAGFASHRFGEYALTILKDKNEATYRIQESVRYYTSWGAFGIVDRLKDVYSELLSARPSRTSGEDGREPDTMVVVTEA